VLQEGIRQVTQGGVEWWQHAMHRMVRCRDGAELLDLTYDAVRGGLGHERVGVFLLDPARRALIERIATDATGCKVYPLDRLHPLDRGFFARLLADPAMRPDGAGYLLCTEATAIVPSGAGQGRDAEAAALYVALRTSEEVLGFIAVTRSTCQLAATPADAAPLVALAAALAATLANLSLRESPRPLRPQPAMPAESPPASRLPGRVEPPIQTRLQRREERPAGRIAAVEATAGPAEQRTLTAHIDAAVAADAPFSVLLVDIDCFKLFNATHGRLAGDRVLRSVASTLRRICGEGDIVVRHGDDEFAVLLHDTPERTVNLALRQLEELLRGLSHSTSDGALIPLSVTTGLAGYPADGSTRRELLMAAESDLCAARRGGRLPARLGHANLLEKGQLAVLNNLVIAVNAKDRYTCRHSEDVTQWALRLAETIGLDDAQRRTLVLAGWLHDIGKIGVPDRVLRKPDRLTRPEYEIMKHHVAFGISIIQGVLNDSPLLDAVAHHHERWDGQGYPRGLKGDQVPLAGRIMQVADAVSAMRLDRPYRRGLPLLQIVDELRKGAGAQFDPDLVDCFVGAVGCLRS
jgi:diguanylate cyclase (GGDEF)-like protein/putative nucleotidyltransferase with HDIG domain